MQEQDHQARNGFEESGRHESCNSVSTVPLPQNAEQAGSFYVSEHAKDAAAPVWSPLVRGHFSFRGLRPDLEFTTWLVLPRATKRASLGRAALRLSPRRSWQQSSPILRECDCAESDSPESRPAARGRHGHGHGMPPRLQLARHAWALLEYRRCGQARFAQPPAHSDRDASRTDCGDFVVRTGRQISHQDIPGARLDGPILARQAGEQRNGVSCPTSICRRKGLV